MSLSLHKVFRRPLAGILRGFVQAEHNTISKQIVIRASPKKMPELPLSLAALSINILDTPPHVRPPQTWIPPPLPLSRVIELPQIQKNVVYEDKLPIKSIEDPKRPDDQEKQAARLIIIRRKKMKKHKLKKLRKKMKYVWAKIKQKRELKKEKMFHAFLLENIKQGQAFDPAKYAAEKIAKAKEEELPQVWHGVKYPDFIIRQLMEEEEKKKKEKEADKKRRASISPYVKDYLENLPK